MALSFEIKQDKLTAGGFSSIAPRQINHGQVITYKVHVTDDADPNRPALQITDAEIMEQSELPTVNETIFGWDNGTETLIIPWLICSGKRVERNPQNHHLFGVVCEFTTGNRFSLRETELNLIEIPLGVANFPYLRESVWKEEERVIYEEAVTGGAQPMRLPTGNLFSEPFKRKHAVRSIRQTQFEQFQDEEAVHEAIEDRMFTVQDITYDGDSTPPPTWMIVDIDYQWVQLPEPGTSSTIEAVMMTYMIEKTTRDGGWFDRRALIDTHYLRQPNTLSSKEAYRDPHDGATVIPALIKADGTLKDDQAGEPDFINFRVQPEGSWSFLRQD